MGLAMSEGFKPPEEGFWHHFCPVHGGEIGFEKGQECDWCGRNEDDTV